MLGETYIEKYNQRLRIRKPESADPFDIESIVPYLKPHKRNCFQFSMTHQCIVIDHKSGIIDCVSPVAFCV